MKPKGKPSGKYAEDKTAPGRRGDYKRSGWPEDASTQRVASARRHPLDEDEEAEAAPGMGRGRNRKAGSPV